MLTVGLGQIQWTYRQVRSGAEKRVEKEVAEKRVEKELAKKIFVRQLAEKMMISGYPEDFRRGVIESAVACYEKQEAASVAGEVPLYRPRQWQADIRRRKKLMAKRSWFRPADAVLRVPCTPGGALAGAVKVVVDEESRRLGVKIKTQEGSGVALRRSVVTSDLGAGQHCPQGDCPGPLCLSGDT